MISPSLSSRVTVTNCLPASKEFLRFLREKEGCDALTTLDESGCVDFRLDEDSITVSHEESTHIQSIENSLKKAWHEADMRKAMRISLLNQLCAHSQTFQFSVKQAALIAFFRHLLLRETGIADLIIESNGTVSCFGPLDCVNHARVMMDRIFQQFLGFEEPIQDQDVYSLSSQHLDSPDCTTTWSDHFSKFYMGDPQPERGISMGSPTELNNEVTQIRIGGTRKRERLMFMVRSSDAPRLIGTRGVNKKRIEDATGCAITLHTESKKDGEFPVEIMGQNARHCEMAKVHIETFLSNSGGSIEEEKKFRERPKVHLVFSPKKIPTTPRKEKEDTSP